MTKIGFVLDMDCPMIRVTRDNYPQYRNLCRNSSDLGNHRAISRLLCCILSDDNNHLEYISHEFQEPVSSYKFSVGRFIKYDDKTQEIKEINSLADFTPDEKEQFTKLFDFLNKINESYQADLYATRSGQPNGPHIKEKYYGVEEYICDIINEFVLKRGLVLQILTVQGSNWNKASNYELNRLLGLSLEELEGILEKSKNKPNYSSGATGRRTR